MFAYICLWLFCCAGSCGWCWSSCGSCWRNPAVDVVGLSRGLFSLVVALGLSLITDSTIKVHGEVEVAEEDAGIGRHNLQVDSVLCKLWLLVTKEVRSVLIRNSLQDLHRKRSAVWLLWRCRIIIAEDIDIIFIRAISISESNPGPKPSAFNGKFPPKV